jgi:hypothetical protein
MKWFHTLTFHGSAMKFVMPGSDYSTNDCKMPMVVIREFLGFFLILMLIFGFITLCFGRISHFKK